MGWGIDPISILLISATKLGKSPVPPNQENHQGTIPVEANSGSSTKDHQQMLKPLHERPLWDMTLV